MCSLHSPQQVHGRGFKHSGMIVLSQFRQDYILYSLSISHMKSPHYGHTENKKDEEYRLAEVIRGRENLFLINFLLPVQHVNKREFIKMNSTNKIKVQSRRSEESRPRTQVDHICKVSGRLRPDRRLNGDEEVLQC